MYSSYYTDCFLNSKYYAEIKEKYNVLFTFVGGSYALDCAIAESDYDITIIVQDNFEPSTITSEYIRFEDTVKVHWYIIPIGVLLNKKIKNKLIALLFFELACLRDDLLLDLVDTDAFNQILNLKDEVSTLGKQYYINAYKNIIQHIDNEKHIKVPPPKAKVLYYLLYLSYVELGDTPDLPKIRLFKHLLRNRLLTVDSYKPFVKQIAKLKTILTNYDTKK